ncbi:ThiF family adenylyltransferase [Daejeonella sp. JGW-45]|uniref:HesA/MoeB/ThiF family protein n=1 Tax=Daejeonella sp. JGW-45 TaxID=3034148 RepID=UPI0023EBBAA1|nr:ThiF family adenylyltransferase [Daejeonella sp. JGW-45]
MKQFTVTITDNVNQQLLDHLLREDGQEDLCFAIYAPSNGNIRSGAIVAELILPLEGDRVVHGNVGFMPAYFERALQVARKKKAGLAFLHSHPVPGWQGMSQDDIVAETRMAPTVMGATDLPLLGLTAGTDGAWSARFWLKDQAQKRKFERYWCQSVKVLGKGLSITFNDALLKPTFDKEKQLRTISAWGSATQEDLSRLKIGIVGLGSVGSIVAEILARTGISNFVLIDFDLVEEKNLDRLTNVFKDHIGRQKVEVIREAILRSATAPRVTVEACPYSICEKEGYYAALDCDILFSCVDRPWPRQVINFIAYAHLVPVIDGGILVRTNRNNTALAGADWKVQTVGYKRPCLECLGQYKAENATLEQSGMLDDPSYLKGLDKASFINAHENVFAFSSNLASLEVLQMLSLFTQPSGIADVGQQMHHFVIGRMNVITNNCHENCFFLSIVGKGDSTGIEVYGEHKVAEETRKRFINSIASPKESVGFINKIKESLRRFFRNVELY